MGFAGQGSPQHVGIELFKMMAGVDLTLVPYQGSAPALADLLTGDVHAMFDPLPSSIAHIKNGKLIPLAVTTPIRSEALPDSQAQPILCRLRGGSWYGIGAPKGTPGNIVETLNNQVNAALESASIKARLSELGGIAMSGSPTQFETFIVRETGKYADVIRAAKIALK